MNTFTFIKVKDFYFFIPKKLFILKIYLKINLDI